MILAAVYLLWAYQRAFTGEPQGENLDVQEITFRELATVVPLLAISLFLGFYPKPLFDRTQVAVKDLTEHVRMHGCYDADADANRGRINVETPGAKKGEATALAEAPDASAAATMSDCTETKK